MFSSTCEVKRLDEAILKRRSSIEACDSGLQFIQKGEVSGSVFLAHRDDAHAHSLARFDVTDNRAAPYSASRDVDQELDHCPGLGQPNFTFLRQRIDEAMTTAGFALGISVCSPIQRIRIAIASLLSQTLVMISQGGGL